MKELLERRRRKTDAERARELAVLECIAIVRKRHGNDWSAVETLALLYNLLKEGT